MCLQDAPPGDNPLTTTTNLTTPTTSTPSETASSPLPPHIPLCDAHCHPTDTLSSLALLPAMRASALTVMATRVEDQHLVADVAARHPAPERDAFFSSCAASPESVFVVPAFGWHPWFSHLLYDDEAPEPTYRPGAASTTSGSDPTSASTTSEPSPVLSPSAAKAIHYTSVLSPPPSPTFLTSLPPPIPLSTHLSKTLANLIAHPTALVGEIGLDKAFRLPQPWSPTDLAARDPSLTPGGREGRLLSPHRVRMHHQRVVLAAQLRLAAQARRAISVHGVQAHGVLYDVLSSTWRGHEREVVSRRKRRLVAQGAEDFSSDSDSDPDTPSPPYPPRICLHSFSATPAVLHQYLHPAVPSRIYVSLSSAVNLSTESACAKTDDVIAALPDARILVESDLHTAGSAMDDALEEMYRRVCAVKGWGLEEGVARIADNYRDFIYGEQKSKN